jgi:hypothetical protein
MVQVAEADAADVDKAVSAADALAEHDYQTTLWSRMATQ